MDTQNPQNAPKALKPMPKAKAKGGAKSKRLNTLKSWLLAPSTLGLLVSLFVWISAYKFYSYKALNDPQIKEPVISKLVEWLDEKAIDARFQLRGEQKVVAPVALLAIDDRSVEEVGRWPWSREKIAFVIDKMMKYGAKAIGFDIVFSEPQEDYSANSLKKIYEESKGISTLPAQFSSDLLSETTKSQPDQILADTITKYADKLVLGSFIANSEGGMRPYQDYCRNEVFKATPAGSIIKFNNVSFVVNDEADPFVDLNFDGLFKQIFESLDFHSTESALKKLFNKSSVTQLTPIELQRLKYILHDDKVKYCNRWLDQDDEFFEPAIGAYKQIFAKSPLLKPLLDNLANSKSTSPAEARQQMEPVIAAFKAAVKTHPVSQDNDWTINTAKIQDAATYTACFVAEQDQDGTIRKNSPFFRTGNKIGLSFVPSLALQTYLVATGYRALVEINNDPRNPKQKVISQFSIQDPNKDSDSELFSVPVDERGKMQINYAGGRNMYAYLSAKELFSDSEDAEITQSNWDESTKSWRSATSKVKKADFIKDKAFIFGATAIGIYDLRVTLSRKIFRDRKLT